MGKNKHDDVNKSLRQKEFMLLDDRHLKYNLNRCNLCREIKRELPVNSVYLYKEFLQKNGLAIQDKICNN